MKKLLKNFTILFGALTVVSLIPVIAVMPFCRMVLDDYVYAGSVHRVWVETRSLLPVLQEVLKEVIEFYYSWQGSVTAIFFYIFNASVFRESLYWINLIIHFAIVVYAVYRMSHAVFGSLIHNRKKTGVLLMFFLILFFSVQFVPASTDAFYAFNLCMIYTGYYSLVMVMTANVLESIAEGKPHLIRITLLALFCGCGHLSMGVLMLGVLAAYALYAVLTERKLLVPSLISLGCGLLSLLFNALAPGYQVRASDVDYGMSPVSSVFFSYVHSFEKFNEFTTIYTIGVFAAGLLLILHIHANQIRSSEVVRHGFSYRFPLLFVFLSVSIYASMFTANYYALGDALYPRLNDAGYFAWYWLVFLNLVYLFGTLRVRRPEWIEALDEMLFYCVNRYAKVLPAAAAVFLAVSILSAGKLDAVLGINLGRRLMNGSVSRYTAERDAWIRVMEENPETDIVVDDLSGYIDAIDYYHIGIGYNGDRNWVNGAMSTYYHVNSFTVIGEEE
ncbi:MAG: hypothetical protein IKS32_08265 [Solobacterium sp.]|nr:hypothetical protein [Solobacterium sp.]